MCYLFKLSFGIERPSLVLSILYILDIFPFISGAMTDWYYNSLFDLVAWMLPAETEPYVLLRVSVSKLYAKTRYSYFYSTIYAIFFINITI